MPSTRKRRAEALDDAIRCSVGSIGASSPLAFDSSLEDVLGIAGVHGIGGAVASHLLRDGRYLSGPAVSILRSTRAAATALTLQLVDASAHVGHSLESSEIAYVVFKGPALGALHHPSPAFRTAVDLDVLVSPSSFGDALEALLGGGATLLDRNWSLLTSVGHAELTLAAPSGATIDLHWHVVASRERRLIRCIDTDELLSRRRLVQIAPDVRIPTLDATDTLIHLCVHAADSGGDRLLWLFDIHSAVEAEPPDWAEVIARAQRYRVSGQVALMLHRAALVYGTPTPNDLATRLGQAHWARISGLIDRFSPPGRAYPKGSVSRSAARATREDATASLLALTSRGLSWAGGGAIWQKDKGRAGLAFAPDDSRASTFSGGGSLADYLAMVSTEAGGPS